MVSTRERVAWAARPDDAGTALRPPADAVELQPLIRRRPSGLHASEGLNPVPRSKKTQFGGCPCMAHHSRLRATQTRTSPMRSASVHGASRAWLTLRAIEHRARRRRLRTLAAEQLRVQQITRPSMDAARSADRAHTLERAHRRRLDALHRPARRTAPDARRSERLLEFQTNGTTSRSNRSAAPARREHGRSWSGPSSRSSPPFLRLGAADFR